MAERRVRTPEGADKYDQAIGDVIRGKGRHARGVLARLGEQMSLFDKEQGTLGELPDKPTPKPPKPAAQKIPEKAKPAAKPAMSERERQQIADIDALTRTPRPTIPSPEYLRAAKDKLAAALGIRREKRPAAQQPRSIRLNELRVGDTVREDGLDMTITDIEHVDSGANVRYTTPGSPNRSAPAYYGRRANIELVHRPNDIPAQRHITNPDEIALDEPRPAPVSDKPRPVERERSYLLNSGKEVPRVTAQNLRVGDTIIHRTGQRFEILGITTPGDGSNTIFRDLRMQSNLTGDIEEIRVPRTMAYGRSPSAAERAEIAREAAETEKRIERELAEERRIAAEREAAETARYTALSDADGNPIDRRGTYRVGRGAVKYVIDGFGADGELKLRPATNSRTGRRRTAHPSALRATEPDPAPANGGAAGLYPGITSFGVEIKAPQTINDLASLQDILRMSPQQREAEIKKIEGEYGNGVTLYNVKLSGNLDSPYSGEVSLTADIRDDKGQIGRMRRSISTRNGKLNVHNDWLNLDGGKKADGSPDPERGKGKQLASNLYPALESWYRRSNIYTVDILASLTDGAYTWAKSGFTWDKSQSSTPGKSALRHGLNSVDDLNALIQSHQQKADSLANRPDQGENYAIQLNHVKHFTTLRDHVTDADRARLRTMLSRFDHRNKDMWPTPFEIATFTTEDGTSIGRALFYRATWAGIKYL